MSACQPNILDKTPPCDDPCDCGAETSSSTSILLGNGDIQQTVVSWVTSIFNISTGMNLVNSNQLEIGDPPCPVSYGNNNVNVSLAYAVEVDDNPSTIHVTLSQHVILDFVLISGSYVALDGADTRYELTIYNDVITVTNSNGETWTFADFDQEVYLGGVFLQYTSPGGHIVTATYDEENQLLVKLEQTDGITTVSFEFEYDNDLIESATWKCDGANIERVDFEYYTSFESSKGMTDDLKKTKRYIWKNGGWVEREVQYIRYYTQNGLDGNNYEGFEHGLKLFVGARAYQSMLDDGLTPESATDTVLKNYADGFFQYDQTTKRAKAAQKAGGGEYTYDYTPNPDQDYTDGYNNWKIKTVEDQPDGGTLTVYTNYLGQPLLKELVDAEEVDNWVEYFVYGEDVHNAGRLVEHWTPAAVESYVDNGGTNGDELVVTSTGGGLTRLTEYYTSTTATSTTAGGAKGYVRYQKIRYGDSCMPIKISETKYFSRSDGTTTIYPVAEQIVFQSDAGGGSDPATTKSSYTWYSGTHQVQERTVELPVVAAAQNGPGGSTGATRKEYVDSYGNLTWSLDERGRVTYHQYDAATGARTRTIQDVDGYQSAELDPPTGYAGQSGGLHLVSDFQSDDQGRVTRSLGPAHNSPLPLDEGEWESASVRTAVWTVYDDANHQVRTVRGYAAESQPGSGEWDVFNLINPVSIAKQNNAGRTLESISATWDATIQEFLAADHDDFPQSTFVRWTTNQYDASGRLTSTRVYHNLPDSGVGFSGTHYAQTAVDYDATGRQNMQTTPGGTITRTTFDCRGNRTGDYVGTDDTGATDADPTNSSANGMKLVTEYEYEGAGGDCACSGGLTGGLLSTLTKHVDDSTTRVSEYQYDWRNRQEYAVDPADADDRVMYTKNYHDNLNRAWKVERYYDADADGHFPSDDTVDEDDRLLARALTYHDDLSRAYKAETYAVDPDDGTVGNALTNNTWYDAAGNVIKQKSAGSDSFTKTAHDGLNRAVKTYLGYDTDETLYADAGTVDGDTIFEQSETTYNPAGEVTWTVTRSRLHDATGTGELSEPDGSQPKARVSYSATWYDPLGRQIVAAAYGTVLPDEGRPEEPPTQSNDVLVSSVEYDSTGQAYRTVDAKGREDRREFDAAGRVVRTIENYCSGSNADDKNVTVEHTYTIDGALSTLTAKNSTTGDQVTQYVYGATLTDSDIADTRLLRGVIYPDSDDTTSLGNGVDTLYDRVEHKYNCQGEVKETKDQNGTIHQFEFDLLGRQTADKATALGTDVDDAVRRVECDYEVRGMLAKATQYDAATGGYAVNEVELSYDDFGNLIADHQEHDGAVNQDTLQVQYAHANGTNNHARLTSITYPNGRVLHHEYSTGADNNLSRLSYLSETDANGTRYADYTYLGRGQIVKVDYTQPDLRYNLAHGVGNDPHDGLDRFGRVVDLLWYDYGSSADAVRIKHGYDRASNRSWREDTVAKAQGTPVYIDERYTYDGMYQLAALQRGQLNAAKDGLVAESKTFAEQWTLDPLGNWGNFKQDDDGDGDWDLDQNRTHNEANEIATIAGDDDEVAHDRSGNMIRAPKPDNWASHYHLEYDAWNRLVTVYDADGTTLVAGYDYDGLGGRVIKETYDEGSLTEMRHYYYSNRWQVLEERVQQNYGSSGSASAPESLYPERQFVWGIRYVDDLILRDRDADADSQTGNYGKTSSGLDERLYALQDPNWNVVAIANTSGVIQERYCYTAYGKPTFLSGVFGSPSTTSGYSWDVLYTGRQYDVETGFMYNRWRYFHTLLGRWLSEDPIADDINLYNYVENSPLTRSDPSGLAKCQTGPGLETPGPWELAGVAASGVESVPSGTPSGGVNQERVTELTCVFKRQSCAQYACPAECYDPQSTCPPPPPITDVKKCITQASTVKVSHFDSHRIFVITQSVSIAATKWWPPGVPSPGIKVYTGWASEWDARRAKDSCAGVSADKKDAGNIGPMFPFSIECTVGLIPPI